MMRFMARGDRLMVVSALVALAPSACTAIGADWFPDRVLRGGSWGSNPGVMRATYRCRCSPTNPLNHNVEFRCARTPW
ncbi:MAG: hypothetical protein HY905_24480 [Deltaproteobacteria bacterium]|nr:hypothetical protein [Deltaproteobacteria bacterium]